jgi:hypothetical protein
MDYKQRLDVLKRCQRNWNKDFVIPKEHINELVYVASNTPTKQYQDYFNLYVITNRELLDELIEYTYGFVMPYGEDHAVWRNPQMGANVYFLWTGKIPTEIRNYKHNGATLWEEQNENIFTSIGVSSGILAYHAAGLGYSIGYNRNHWNNNDEDYWHKALDIPSTERIILGQGIGKPKYENHNHSDEYHFLVNDEIVNVDKPLVYPSFTKIKNRPIKVKLYE